MHKIPYLKTICDQIVRLEVFANTDNLPNEILARINHALALCSHLLDELAQPQYNSVYFEHQLAQLVKRMGVIAQMVA
jgi:hypothetical protein